MKMIVNQSDSFCNLRLNQFTRKSQNPN